MNIMLVQVAWFIHYSHRKWSSDFGLSVGEFTTGYPNLVKTSDPWLLPPQNCWKGCMHCCLDGTHYDSLGKILTTKTNNKISYTTILCNIPSNINKQTNINNIPCKTKVHIWSLKSNTKLSRRHPQWSRHFERRVPQKERFGYLFRAPLFLGKWYGVTTYFSLYKKK